MDDVETTRETLEHAEILLRGTASLMNGMTDYMREALELFVADPPDSDFQRGYHEALKVFAHEAMGFKSDDPLLWHDAAPAVQPVPKPRFSIIDGGKSEKDGPGPNPYSPS